MFKLMYFALLVSSILTFLIFCCESFTCVHDETVEHTILKRSIKYHDVKKQQIKDFKSYEPLNIYFYIDKFDESISASVVHNIELALRKIRSYISVTFKVYKRKRPFVLSRNACVRKWQSGPNKGKCSKLANDSEVCVSRDITYPIPDRFLDKLEIYEYDRERPQHELPQGSGLLESNFVVFLTSESSKICEGSDVSAFGTFCRLDPKTNEPLAGILNLCPAYFARKMYPANHYYHVFLHELFHILGFSIHLFEKYLPCHKGVYCDFPKNLIQEDSNGIPRLMFPLVVENMQKHFSCSDADFGAPMVLEVTNSTENEEEDETEHLTSHWDPLLMYSSVMTDKFSEYDHIYVDNITLSVFGSTGWYLVNYAQAENFRFGKGQGCGFGINGTCNDNIFLCDPNAEDLLGCDVTHKVIGKCTKLSPQRTCGVYLPYNKESCELNLGRQYGLDFYALGYQQGCFMISEEGNNATATCLPLKCKSNSTYNVLINMLWYDCFSEQKIDAKNVSLYCPESSLLCTKAMIEQRIPRQMCYREKSFFIAMRMYFQQPTFNDLVKKHSFKNFKVATLKRIAEIMDIPVNFIVNSSLSVFKTLQLDFTICPTLVRNEDQLSLIILKVQNFLDKGHFMQILDSDTISSSSDVNLDPLGAIKFSDHEGFRTLLIFPAVCVIFLVATLVASIMRWLSSKSFIKE